MNILGATIRGAQMKLGRGHAVNPAAIFNQIDRMGVGAIPVVVGRSGVQAGPFRAPGLPGRARGREARDAAGLPCQNL